jgi:hypothetical protein
VNTSTTCFVTILAFCRAATLKHFDSSNKNIYLVFWLQRRTTLSKKNTKRLEISPREKFQSESERGRKI